MRSERRPTLSFVERTVLYTLVYVGVIAVADELFSGVVAALSVTAVIAVSFFAASTAVLGDMRKVPRTPPRWEREAIVVAAACFWLGVGIIDLTGPRHSPGTLSTGAIFLAMNIGGEILQARRARKREPDEPPPA